MTRYHGRVGPNEGVHTPFAWTFADAAARAAFAVTDGEPSSEGSLTSEDIGRVALDSDTGAVHVLASLSPTTWTPLQSSLCLVIPDGGIVIGDQTPDAASIGIGSIVVGGYRDANKNRMSGTRTLRAIVGGYDNEITAGTGGDNGGLACMIVGSHHSEISGTTTHGAVVGGSYGEIQAGDYGAVVGGTQNKLKALQRDDSTAGDPTTAAILGGYDNEVSGGNSAIVAGRTNIVDGAYSASVSGRSNIVDGDFCAAVAGDANLVAHDYAATIGGKEAVTRWTYSQVMGASKFAANGDAQTSVVVRKVQTTDGTAPFPMSTLVMADDTTIAFDILIVARRTDADGESAAYRITGCIDRNSGAATTALVGAPTVTVLGEDTSAWDVSVAASTSGGGLQIRVAGESGKTIMWVARCTLVEVTG